MVVPVYTGLRVVWQTFRDAPQRHLVIGPVQQDEDGILYRMMLQDGQPYLSLDCSFADLSRMYTEQGDRVTW